MKAIHTDGITFIEAVPGSASEWYYGMDHPQGDLYEAEQVFRSGGTVAGRKLCLVHYPDGRVFFPFPAEKGHYCEKPVFLDGGIFIPDVDFSQGRIRIFRFGCGNERTEVYAELPLSSVKDCYNLQLQVSPLTLSRQCVGTHEFEILWPERVSFPMGGHDSFFLRDGSRLFFSRWYEEGEGENYRYWEETIVRDLNGTITETIPGDVMRMPDGEIWQIQ